MSAHPTSALTLLIVDDTPSNLGMVVGLFEDHGYRVAIAQDGKEGLDRARRIAPDLILLDVMMPGMDGFEACRLLKADPATADIPVIFMTALADIGHRVEGFKVGGIDYVTKPLHLDEIAARVETHLKLRATQRQLEAKNAELALHRDGLEELVAARTDELSVANEALRLKSHALANSFDATYLIDADMRFRYVNEAASRATGYSRDELLSMRLPDIDPSITPEEIAELMRQTAAAPAGRLPGTLESRYRRKDGTTFPTEIGATTFVDAGETLYLAVVRDITERQAAEERIRYSERKFRTLAENAPDNIARYDREGRLVYINPHLAGTLKRTATDLLGRTVSEANPEMDGFAHAACIATVLATGRSAEVEATLPDTGDGPRHHHIRLVAERDVDGEILGVLAIGRDVTEQRRERAALAESRDLLRQLSAHRDAVREEERKRIAREIHDELGQMLTAQRLDLATLKFQFGETQPGLAERSQHMIDTADRTIQVVRNIATMLRPAALDMGLVPALEWLAAEFRKRSGIACRLSLSASDDIRFDEAQSVALFRIVQESLTNVARYAEARCVDIALSGDDACWRLAIRDDGKGFDAEISRSDSFGLAGIRERALMLGGTARIDSAPGAGTTIEIRIPHHAVD